MLKANIRRIQLSPRKTNLPAMPVVGISCIPLNQHNLPILLTRKKQDQHARLTRILGYRQMLVARDMRHAVLRIFTGQRLTELMPKM